MKMSFAPLKAFLVVWVLSLIAPHSTHAQAPLFTIFKRWPLPDHGEGKHVVVPSTASTEAGLRAVGEELRHSGNPGQDAFVLIFNDAHAAAMHQRHGLTPEEHLITERHLIGKYVRNRDTHVHELEIFPSGINGPSRIIAFS